MEHLAAFHLLESSTLDWSFFCPPNIIDADTTGLYQTSTNFPPEPNSYTINAGDLAMAMLDAGLKGTFIKERVGISN
jgi:putative NADH-flavin reductase